jgi:RimJ/RimL family protein N-acetyltransferase
MFLSGDLSETCILSERLTLRAFASVDAAEFFAGINPRIAKYMSWNPPASMKEYEGVWTQLLAHMKQGWELSLVARLSTTSEFLGLIGLHPAEGDLLETGLWLKEAAHGRGYGREAIAATIRWASDAFHPAGFLYPVVDENTPSCRLAESLGGVVTGTRQRQKPGDANRTLLLYRIPAPS